MRLNYVASFFGDHCYLISLDSLIYSRLELLIFFKKM